MTVFEPIHAGRQSVSQTVIWFHVGLYIVQMALPRSLFACGQARNFTNLTALPANFIIINGGLATFYFDRLFTTCPAISNALIGYLMSEWGTSGIFFFSSNSAYLVPQICLLMRQYLLLQIGYGRQEYIAFVLK